MKETIQAKLDKDDLEKLKKVSAKKGHTVSSLVRLLIKKFLKTREVE